MRLRHCLFLSAVIGLAATPSLAGAQTFGTNLIVNGDAEADLGSPDGTNTGAPVTGFATTTGEFTVVQYSDLYGYPTSTDPGPVNRGANFFDGGNVALSSGSQRINVAGGAGGIDAGTATYSLSAWLGGYATQEDNAVLAISFLSASSGLLGSAQIGPVSATDRGSVTSLLLRTDSGLVPVGTRAIDVTLTLSRATGYSDDGYADDLSLVLTGSNPSPVPEPGAASLALAGLGVFMLRRRRVG